MRTCSTLHATVTSFFVATNLIVCIKSFHTDTNPSESDITSVSSLPQEISTTSSSTPTIEPLPIKVFHRRIPNILSPDIFSQPDPLAYLLTKLTRYVYTTERESLTYELRIKLEFESLSHRVEFFLEGRKFPRPYLRYAKLLAALTDWMVKLHRVSLRILILQQQYGTESNYPPPPTGISTPELRALFSTDIFSDPNIPSVLVKEILKIPEDRMSYVKADLSKLSSTHSPINTVYHEYRHFLQIFLQHDDEIHRLRYENAQIQRRLQKNKTD